MIIVALKQCTREGNIYKFLMRTFQVGSYFMQLKYKNGDSKMPKEASHILTDKLYTLYCKRNIIEMDQLESKKQTQFKILEYFQLAKNTIKH